MEGRRLFRGLSFIVCLMMLSASIVMAQDLCQGDFNYNGSVAAEDVTVFLEHFGRSQYNNPCPPDGPAPVAKTGQTTCYNSSGDPVSCQLVITLGQDGNRKGVTWPNPRFTNNLNGTVTDNLTGLIWLKNANCFGQRTWANAISDCNGLSSGYCGLTDGSLARKWRLPNRFEMESLLDLGNAGPTLPTGHPFTNVQSYDYYWSSTTYAFATDFAWSVRMSDGYLDFNGKTNYRYVWPVRGGQ